MGLLYGAKLNNIVSYGTRGDVCVLCAREKAVEDKTDLVMASNKLRGNLDGRKVVKFRQSGADVVICLDHIHRISAENKEAEVVLDGVTE